MTQRVLIIEDYYDFGRAVFRTLQKSGYEAAIAGNGKEGIAQATAFEPDLILLDIHLPDIDGIALYKILKQDSRTRDIPIILMTGETFIDNVLKAISTSLHASAIYLKGSLDLNGLMERVRKTLSDPLRNQDESADASAAEGVLRRGSVVFDLVRREVRLPDRPPLRLAARPFDLLVALLRQEGPVSRHELRLRVWSESAVPNVVCVTVLSSSN